MKIGEDVFIVNKENIELNFDVVKEVELIEIVFFVEGREFKFVRLKCLVGGRKILEYNLFGRFLFEFLFLVIEYFNFKC